MALDFNISTSDFKAKPSIKVNTDFVVQVTFCNINPIEMLTKACFFYHINTDVIKISYFAGLRF